MECSVCDRLCARRYYFVPGVVCGVAVGYWGGLQSCFWVGFGY